MEQFDNFIKNNKNSISEIKSKNYNALVFAFVGDAVFTMFVRTYLATKSTAKAGVLHTKCSNIVRASFQSGLLDILFPMLNEDELAIVKTARNEKTNNIAKNSNVEEYKKSTSFEALLGYLYITNNNARLLEILEICKGEFDVKS